MLGTPERFYLLDIIRAAAALIIVVVHTKYFYLLPDGTYPDGFAHSDQIFYAVLSPIYHYGATSVQVFFCMSGFIFFWLYVDSIQTARTSAWAFFVFRFSRLYPLHFATLIFVACAQWWFADVSGGYIVFGPNTQEQFIYQLFLASEWGVSGASSFNGPIWTVSGEVAAYAVFFLMASARRAGIHHVVIAMLLAGLVHEVNHRLGHALFFFFTGGLIYLVWNALRQRFSRHVFLRFLLPLATLTLAGTFTVVPWLPRFEGQLVLWFVVAPLCVVVPVLVQSAWPTLGRRCAPAGDLSYGIYLLHFPIQIVIIGLAWEHGHLVNVTPTLFFGYVTGLVIAAVLVFCWFEKPCQNAIRRAWLRPHRRALPAGTGSAPQPAS
ncbi:MAG: acyltransferase [Pseudomonadota bacterium]